MEPLYTLECPDGLYLVDHPTLADGCVAQLYRQALPALQKVEELENPEQWVVIEIEDLELWLEQLIARGVTHVADHTRPDESEIWRIHDWLYVLQSSGVSG